MHAIASKFCDLSVLHRVPQAARFSRRFELTSRGMEPLPLGPSSVDAEIQEVRLQILKLKQKSSLSAQVSRLSLFEAAQQVVTAGGNCAR